MKNYLFVTIVMLCSVSMAAYAHASRGGIPLCEGLSSSENQHAHDLVHEAVELIGLKGEEAFKDFSVRGSQWFRGDDYIFVHAMDGTLVCNPAFPDMIGDQMIDFKDVTGKPFIRFMRDQVTEFGRDSGWVHYLWPVPGEVEPRWKSSYVHRAVTPGGTSYYVGTGHYSVPMEKCFAIQQVKDAVQLIRKSGPQSFDIVRSRSGPFVWKKTYVLVIGTDGMIYVNPAQPGNENMNMLNFLAADGSAPVKRFIELLEKQESGWVTYSWPKPGSLEPSTKHTYLELVRFDGVEYMVGCGLYLD